MLSSSSPNSHSRGASLAGVGKAEVQRCAEVFVVDATKVGLGGGVQTVVASLSGVHAERCDDGGVGRQSTSMYTFRCMQTEFRARTK